jgi:hypothetical protein
MSHEKNFVTQFKPKSPLTYAYVVSVVHACVCDQSTTQKKQLGLSVSHLQNTDRAIKATSTAYTLATLFYSPLSTAIALR